jgi:hypothetical protein
VKKWRLSKKQSKCIEEFVIKKLSRMSLKSWQQACESLAPPNYNKTTRHMWFEENKHRAPIGREIVEFVNEASRALQEKPSLSNVPVSELRSGIVRGIRRVEIAQQITKYLLNDVKLATLKTIVGWVARPDRIVESDVSIHSPAKRRPRRGRKSEKGKYSPPEVKLVNEWEVLDKATIRITSLLLNKYIHPYQNVEVEIDVDPNLILTSVSPYSWLPEDHLVRIGYLQAELDIEPFETLFTIDLQVKRIAESFSFSWRVHYDNCERGIRDVSDMNTTLIRLLH